MRLNSSGLLRVSIFILCCLGVMILSREAYAQADRQADQYFAADQFHKAATIYQHAFQQDTTDYRVAYRLAECYRQIFSYHKALHYYRMVQAHEARNFPLSVFYYAMMLKYNQDFEAAVDQFSRFIRDFDRPDLARYVAQAKKEKQGCYLAIMEQETGRQYTFYRLEGELNTDYNEFAPAILAEDSLLFITSSNMKSVKGKMNNRMGESFTDNLMFARNASGTWEQAQDDQHLRNINSKWNDGSGCFNADKDKYYFTSCQSDGFCRLYVSSLKNSHWQKPVALNENVNLPNTNTKHPALSASGDSLFFVSDRAGGQGGLDIWLCVANEEGQWKPAVNLGKAINTPFNEISPFYISQENMLVFASDGHEGMGGMDLYWTEMHRLGGTPLVMPDRDGTPQDKPAIHNFGSPFNSSRDDCYLVVENEKGLLASNRYQSFDIYGFDKPAYQSFKAYLQSKSAIATYSNAPAFQHMITDAGIDFPVQDKSIMAVRSSEKERLRNGSTRFILNADVDDILLDKFRRASEREKEEQQTQESLPLLSVFSRIDSMGISTLFGYPILALQTHTLLPSQKGEVKGQLFNAAGDSALNTITLHLTTERGKLVKITTTNEAGEFRFVNLEPDAIYHIVIASSGMLPGAKIEARSLILEAYGEEMHTFKYENIYFDFNRSALRNEAKEVLKELAAFWLANPDLQIEINAFTDSTGNADYNLQLSQERGQSALEYLIDLGVDRSALVIDARGISTDIYAEDPFVSQQLNRRVEFEVIGRGIKYQPEYETHILKPKVTFYDLMQTLGMKKSVLQDINGLQEDELQAYRPVRVKIVEGKETNALFYDILKR